MYFSDEFTGRAKYHAARIPEITPILYGYVAKINLEYETAKEPDRLSKEHKKYPWVFFRAFLWREPCTAERN